MADTTKMSFFVKHRVFVAVVVSTIVGISLMVIVQPREFLRQEEYFQLDNSKKSSSTKPNFVFVLADDLAWNSLDYDGFDLTFVTPELSSLADDGIKMTNYYAQEYCNPSRASLLTGRYPVNMGMQYGVGSYDLAWGLRLEETLLPEVLSDNGYSNYMFGKWHLGHFNERYLPTARGFDTWTGYVDGQNEYYSKRDPTIPVDEGGVPFRDFLTSNTDCYYAYDGPNLHNYSTHLYKDLAIETIYNHDQSNPMFMYLAFQAVHIPYIDDDGRLIDSSFMESWMYDKIKDNIVGLKRQYYAMALNVLDTAVSKIKDALDDVGMLDNTYIIFASDNGGCYLGGGKAYPLRGTKFMMLEGGTKVDAFIYSTSLIDDSLRGSKNANLMHVSDWFPTILELADITYDADDDYSLDGFSQVSAWTDGDAVRTDMLYNSYTNVKDMDFDIWTNAPFAIRDSQYKLIHFYNGSYADWFSYETESSDDDGLETSDSNCIPTDAMDGDFVYALYDLTNDPYEKNNLYYDDEDDDDISTAKTELYALIDEYNDNSVECVYDTKSSCKSCKDVFREAGNYVVPWVSGDDGTISSEESTSYPSYCGVRTSNAITSI